MRGKHVFLGGFAATALSFLWLACSSSSSDSQCPLGAETCACTEGGGCDKGLTCLSSRCVKAPTGTTTTGGSAGSSTTNTSTSSSGTGGKAGAGGSGGAGGTSTTSGTAGSSAGGSSGTGGAGGTSPTT